LHAVTRQQFAPGGVLGSGRFAAALGHTLQVGTQVIDQATHGGSVVLKIGGSRVQLGMQNGHGDS
jgi:hypothetical protein